LDITLQETFAMEFQRKSRGNSSIRVKSLSKSLSKECRRCCLLLQDLGVQPTILLRVCKRIHYISIFGSNIDNDLLLKLQNNSSNIKIDIHNTDHNFTINYESSNQHSQKYNKIGLQNITNIESTLAGIKTNNILPIKRT
jgi:hypothetical protein